jgi:FtsH-binding integral membrane protein
MTTSIQTNPTASPIGTYLRAGALAAVVAAIGGIVMWVIITSVLNIALVIPMPPDNVPTPLPVFMVIMASVVPAIGATILLAILNRFTARGLTIFQIIAIVFLLLSLIGPFMLPVDTSVKLALVALHIVVGVAITGVLTVNFRNRS